MIHEARHLHRLFKRGFLADSPDFIQEKQHDGRYILQPVRIAAPAQSIHVHVPTGLIKTITYTATYRAGPPPPPVIFVLAATFERIPDGPAPTVDYTFNAAPFPNVGRFRTTFAPNYIGAPGESGSIVKLFFENADIASNVDVHLEGHTGQGLNAESNEDFSSGLFTRFYDVPTVPGNITLEVTIVWDR